MNKVHVGVLLLVTLSCLLLAGATTTEVVVSESVIGTGGARIGDNDNIILGTLGQPLVGRVT